VKFIYANFVRQAGAKIGGQFGAHEGHGLKGQVAGPGRGAKSGHGSYFL
jgi:hypothetical protein